MVRKVLIALLPSVAAGRLLKAFGAGDVYKTQGDACSACAEHKDYLDSPKHITIASRGCSCFAIDINGVFENDATKKATFKDQTTTEGGDRPVHEATNESMNTGDARLATNYKWHCQEVHGAGVDAEWKAC